MSKIVILGLGAGDGRYLTREAWKILESAEKIYLRTANHPVVAELPCRWESFDEVYESAETFPEVYSQITQTVIASAPCIYAVPGDPHVGEATTFLIQEAAKSADIPVRIVRGLSFIEPTLGAIGLDGMDGLQVYDAMQIASHLHAPVNPDAPLLLAQLYAGMIASELKLSLMAVYDAEYKVALVHGAGTDDATVEWLPLYQIDQSVQLGNLTSLYVPARPQISSLGNFADTIAILRSPNGCPWDQEQTPQSLRSGLLEEAAEVVDALDRDDIDDLREELGDLLLHIVMQTQMATEAGDFTLADVVEGIDEKIKRRHPHVWGDLEINTIADLNETWDAIKREEKGEQAVQSVIDNVPASLPALVRSQKIQKKARKVGFDWPDIQGVYDKIAEELQEVREALGIEELSAEIGDLLFVIVNLASWLGVEAETAMREANLKFIRRFQSMETIMRDRNLTWQTVGDINAIEALWQESKRAVG